MKVYIIANQKGGIAKTTTATAVASILTSRGKRVLMIDADSQGNASDTYRAKIEGQATLYDVMLEDKENRIPVKDAIQHCEMGDIIASDPLLKKGDQILNGDTEGIYRLQDAIKDIENEYDHIVIDTAPALNSILYNCLIAGNDVIVPVTTDRYGLAGLFQLSETVEAIKRRQNPDLRISGLLLVKYNPRINLSKDVTEFLEDIAKKMNTKVYSTKIRESVKAREAQAERMPLIKYARGCTTERDYEDFIDELEEDE